MEYSLKLFLNYWTMIVSLVTTIGIGFGFIYHVIIQKGLWLVYNLLLTRCQPLWIISYSLVGAKRVNFHEYWARFVGNMKTYLIFIKFTISLQ